MPVQDNDDKRTADQPVVEAEELRRKQAQSREQQQDETSVQKSGKLLPLLNAKAEHHQSRIDSLDERIANQTDKIDRNKAKIEVLSAKADKLEDTNRMLKATIGNLPGIGAVIALNEKRIQAIREEKIPERQQKIDQGWKKIDALTDKRDRIEHKLNRVIALNDTIKSFSIGFNKERREAFADAMTRLNGATVDCLSDKKATLEAKKQKILDTYNDPATSVVDKYNLSEQLKDVNERISALDDKIMKLACPEKHYEEQVNDQLDASMKLTGDKLGEMVQKGNIDMPTLAESAVQAAQKVETLDRSKVAELADQLNIQPLANVEMQLEDDYNMIDGIINNGSKEDIDKAKAELAEGIKSMESLAENPFVPQEMRDNAVEELAKMKSQLELLNMHDEVEVDSWLSDMLDKGDAVLTDDGGFKMNPDYYKELPRNDRHVETMTEIQAVEVMSALMSAGVQFSAATKGEDKVGITVSKNDVSTLNDVMYASIGKIAHTDAAKENGGKGEKGKYETINPEYYASLGKDDKHTRVEPIDTARKIVAELQKANIPYSAVVRKNDTVSVTVSKANAQAYKQIESAVKGERAVEYVNPDFFKSLPKQERFTQRMDEGQARKKSAELTAKGVEHSAVFGGEKSAVTVAKKDSKKAFFSRGKMQRDAQRISGQGQQKPQQTPKMRNDQGLEQQMRITDEQKERANLVNLPQFLMSHGFDLKKVGKEYVWKEHDSLHIKDNGPGECGQWFRFSENKGGGNIGLLREYMDMSFLDAVEALTGEHIDRTYTPSRTYESKPVQQTARELSLAEADNCRRVFAYLCKTRGLDYDMLSALVKKGIISQEEKTGNVLFKYYDDQGKVIGAEKVGTSTEHKFKGIATGSAGGHGFEVVHGTGEKAFFFESAIDMLSYLQMHSKELDNCRLVSMMGVKPSIVLDTMLRHNIAPENVFLCSDNDTAGNEFARRLQEQYPDMKRIITPDTYKDWNDMLRNIPKQIKVEQETKTKEVDSVADLMTYGNKMWNNATDNRDKSLISMQLADFQRVQEMLEKSGINYYAYEMNGTVRMAVNDKNTDWLRKILGNMNVTKSNRPYFPPEKNIIGNTEYRYIPQKEYVTADRDLVLKMADIMARRGMQFSGRIYPSGKGTLTVSHADFVAVRNIKDEVISMRKQFASPDKAQEVGNRDYCANRDTRYYMSKLTPEQFKEVKPFLETSVSYHAVSREGKVAFAVDKENAPAFHRALENAVREVGMLRNMADLGLTMEQNVALSPVVHRLAVEDVKLNLADFFDNRYDEAQFGEMLSLVDAYLSQAPAERYGEHSKLNDMLEAKSSFDRSIELSDFFSQHDFSDEQRTAITAMFIGDVTKGQIDSIDETFTAEDIQAYDEILHNALQESDVADFLTAHKQAVTDRENASKVPTEEEVLFQQADLAKFLAERTLSSDEWEDMAYPLFSSGYLDKHNPSDKATFGYNLSESALYDLAQRFHDGEDIRRELALGLLRGGTTADIEFIFEQGEISDRTYYYAENLRHALHTEKTEDGYHCSFSGMERFVSFEEIGQAFIDRIHEEFDDLAYWAVLDYIKDDIPDISDDTVKELITAFDGAALHGWENGDNQPKLNRIKKALFDVLGDEEQTEKAFACIAKHKYNVTFEPEQPEKQPDSLTFHFGKGDGDEWVSESDIVHDFVLAHPDCSFALGNAVLEYLDEKQHSERNIPDLKAGWYKKTDFTITAIIGGEEFSYEGRFDIGDGKGTGGGSLIDHIRAHNEGILGYTQHPFNQPEYQERAKHTLDVFVPFLEAHSELTAEEQRIFDDFKEQHPIRVPLSIKN